MAALAVRDASSEDKLRKAVGQAVLENAQVRELWCRMPSAAAAEGCANCAACQACDQYTSHSQQACITAYKSEAAAVGACFCSVIASFVHHARASQVVHMHTWRLEGRAVVLSALFVLAYTCGQSG